MRKTVLQRRAKSQKTMRGDAITFIQGNRLKESKQKRINKGKRYNERHKLIEYIRLDWGTRCVFSNTFNERQRCGQNLYLLGTFIIYLNVKTKLFPLFDIKLHY